MRPSAIQRLTALIALSVLGVTLLGMGGQYLLVKYDLEIRQEQFLRSELSGFGALYDQRRVIAVRQAIEFRLLQDTKGDQLLVLETRAAVVLAGNVGIWPTAVIKPAEGLETEPLIFVHRGQNYLGIARTLAGNFPLLVARSTADVDATLSRMRQIMLAVIAATTLASLFVGYGASRLILRRITRINALADQVGAGDLSARLPGPRAVDEFGTLESHIHAMLDRIEALNRATHHLSDTIAHELRTPLTRMQSRLARIQPPLPDAEVLKQDIRDIIRIFDSLLQIAKAEAEGEQDINMIPLDLAQVVVDVCELYEPVAEERDIEFVIRITPEIVILGDRNLVAQLVSNLLENALKFSPAKATVEVSLTPGPMRSMLEIRDTGPGLPKGFETQIFDRFTRAKSTGKTTGHGLGLALVQAIAIRHGANVTLPLVQKGFAIQIGWPNVRAKQ